MGGGKDTVNENKERVKGENEKRTGSRTPLENPSQKPAEQLQLPLNKDVPNIIRVKGRNIVNDVSGDLGGKKTQHYPSVGNRWKSSSKIKENQQRDSRTSHDVSNASLGIDVKNVSKPLSSLDKAPLAGVSPSRGSKSKSSVDYACAHLVV